MDARIRKEFGHVLKRAERGVSPYLFFSLILKGELESWTATHAGHVALILLVDQCTRHIYRKDSEFENKEQYSKNDAYALQLSHSLLAKNVTQILPLPWLVFGLMPLRHSFRYDQLQIVLSTVQFFFCYFSSPVISPFVLSSS